MTTFTGSLTFVLERKFASSNLLFDYFYGQLVLAAPDDSVWLRIPGEKPIQTQSPILSVSRIATAKSCVRKWVHRYV